MKILTRENLFRGLTWKHLFLGLLVIAFIWIVIEWISYYFQDRKSPEAVMRLYLKARDRGDMKTLREIIYFPPGTPEDEIQNRLRRTVTSSEEKMMSMITLYRVVVEYGKRIDEKTAEVGIVGKGYLPYLPFSRRKPFQQIVFINDGGSWKYHYSKYELTKEQLKEMIKRNPMDADAYFLLGSKYSISFPIRAIRYYKKYLELEPKGFWADDDHITSLFENYKDLANLEKRRAKSLQNLPENSLHRVMGYIKLAGIFAETGDADKATMYLEKSEAASKHYDTEELTCYDYPAMKEEIKSLIEKLRQQNKTKQDQPRESEAGRKQ